MIEGAHYLSSSDQDDVRALARRILTEHRYNPADPEEPALAMVEQAIALGRRVELELGWRTCRVCGCDDKHACVDAEDQPCGWASPNLCTACAPFVEGGA